MSENKPDMMLALGARPMNMKDPLISPTVLRSNNLEKVVLENKEFMETSDFIIEGDETTIFMLVPLATITRKNGTVEVVNFTQA